ncbi:hypothetical protein [Microbispora bryophytorum]|uniref:Uncharacterized protein n=1 Tax=Microbispora bryophytorum TaxID=1460882 RepID=A0A8H9L9V5_9ACTN|nr:hypothetical protein [Microbispora bryophytorum]MBD3139687.1 hypothetical protein [Microbispora bryophytorum]GGO03322.1 hypothetical protein GCM10011574_13050 [Microbispora bryophytorum]
MGWLSKLLLPGRLRTGPTALLPARPDPKTLLAVAQLADPEARTDGDDILAGGSRIESPVELTGDVLAKLGVPDEDRLWACRIAAEGPLPVDFFDKSLAEGIAYRLGGWSLCQGEPLDPAEDGGDPLVYLPAVPEPEEILPILAESLRHADAVDTARWPEGELIEGVVHVPVRRGRVADVYAGADVLVTVEEGHRLPPAAQTRWPYLTEVAIARVSPVARTEEEAGEDAEPAGAASGAAADDRTEDVTSAEAAPGPLDAGSDSEDAGTGASTGAGSDAEGAQAATSRNDAEGTEDTTDSEDSQDSEDSEDTDEARGALLARAAVALALADGLRGIAADSRGFQIAEVADVLPGGHA